MNTSTTTLDIARECAMFASDNAGDPDAGFDLTPEGMWGSWHDKDGIEAPDMPVEFPWLYIIQCHVNGGNALVYEATTGKIYGGDV